MKTLKQILEKYDEDEADDWKDMAHPPISHELEHHYPKDINPEHHAVWNYIGTSAGINSYHWHKHKGTLQPKNNIDDLGLENNHEGKFLQSTIHHLNRQTEEIDKSLHSFKTPKAFTVYSGTKIDPREHMNEHGIVHHPAYLSTTVDPMVGHKFANINGSYKQIDNKKFVKQHHTLQIHVPEGHPGMYVGAYGESEFILPRGTNLKHSHTDIAHGTERENGEIINHTFHTHHMTIEPNK